MIDVKRAFRRLILCLIVVLACTIATAPVLRTESSIVWAKKKTKKKKKEKETTKKEGFVKKNGHYYYYQDGKKQTGWITVGDRQYYGIKSGSNRGRLVTGWYTIRKEKYFFREEGKKGVICSLAIDGTAKVNGIMCVFDEDGELVDCKYAGSTDGFVNKVGELARMNQAKNNILASLVVAQACVETGYGANIYHNNLFGIRSGHGYRHYSSWEKSLEHYTSFMKSYLPYVFGVRNSSRVCSIVGSSGYASARNYGSMLYSIILSHDLTRFNK